MKATRKKEFSIFDPGLRFTDDLKKKRVGLGE